MKSIMSTAILSVKSLKEKAFQHIRSSLSSNHRQHFVNAQGTSHTGPWAGPAINEV